mmetsp:Transcript_87031/g.280930  ORF Transcript_87031/g.280930 Transcript_87031/m.280930 type:complete len:115 (+) Transcript_87031:69-413(+)
MHSATGDGTLLDLMVAFVANALRPSTRWLLNGTRVHVIELESICELTQRHAAPNASNPSTASCNCRADSWQTERLFCADTAASTEVDQGIAATLTAINAFTFFVVVCAGRGEGP